VARPRTKTPKSVETITHVEDTRTNIPTAEYESVLDDSDRASIRVAYERRNRDLDPQLVWRGKDEQDWSDLVVYAPPLYIQEKVHPKVLIDELVRQSKKAPSEEHEQIDLFADFNRLPEGADTTDFYEHEQGWTNRMILGDSLQVMASLAEREGLRGKVQCIYIDPPYGIRFNSNFQWSTTSRDVKEGNAAHITREPEQVKAFRDTWRDGVHSYLTYLRDRLTVARDLLADNGSIFVQIGDENVHRVRSLMDEVFGEENACSVISFVKTTGFLSNTLPNVSDYLLWYSKKRELVKFRQPFFSKALGGAGSKEYTMAALADGATRPLSQSEKNNPEIIPEGARVFRLADLRSQGGSGEGSLPYTFEGVTYRCGPNMHWKTRRDGLDRLGRASRISGRGEGKTLCYVRYVDDFAAYPVSNVWIDAASGDTQVLQKVYVVQTLPKVIQRCILMASDPGDLVLDPTCGSGTTAMVAEQWGRRWITIDTSRVALALARARIMGARYAYYLLSDSREGQLKEADVTQATPSSQSVSESVRHGFVYERVPHITLKSVANNAEVDVIWEKWQEALGPLRESLNRELSKTWEDWEIPNATDEAWSERAKELHSEWWAARVACREEIDASIVAKAEFEFLYDKPYEDKRKVRVAGPFTVESLSPHRVLGVDENDKLIDPLQADSLDTDAERTFTETILENLKAAGVQQAHKEDRITFISLTPWPGDLVCGEGRYLEGETEKRAAIFIGPEFGTVQRTDLVAAAREAGDAGFDALITCAFSYEGHATEFNKLGSIPVLKARMNADLHMADDLKATGKGNLFVIFGEPDLELLEAEDGKVQVRLNGVDVFDPSTGEVRSDSANGIACWFIDTEYNEESFFVRHAYFLGAADPYKALKTTLKAEIDEDAWATLRSDVSRPFDKPETGRIAVKVINHLGDEVMKVFRVG
jgi:adenine-specific DNA-methyltransferase